MAGREPVQSCCKNDPHNTFGTAPLGIVRAVPAASAFQHEFYEFQETYEPSSSDESDAESDRAFADELVDVPHSESVVERPQEALKLPRPPPMVARSRSHKAVTQRTRAGTVQSAPGVQGMAPPTQHALPSEDVRSGKTLSSELSAQLSLTSVNTEKAGADSSCMLQ